MKPAHIVVAWALGLMIGASAIGINGDDAKGRTDIANDEALPVIDKIAICAAGLESQSIFGAPTHCYAGLTDEAKIIDLINGLDEETQLALRDNGYRRARELIVAHSAKVDRIAKALIDKGSIERAEVCTLLD
jgi:hypothetical protein